MIYILFDENMVLLMTNKTRGELFKSLCSLIFALTAEKTGTTFWRLERSMLQSSCSDCGWEENDSEQFM